MIEIKQFTFNPFAENTYLLFDETKACVIIDPGCYEKQEQQELLDYITKKELNVEKVINTHCHIDHVLGNKFCKDTFQVDVLIPPKEEQVLRSVSVYAPIYGFANYQEIPADGFLPEEGEFKFGNSSLKILFVPGHAPGHLAFYAAEQKFCVSGDVLFQGSIGRTDLPGGDHDTLIRSIRTMLFTLPEDTTIYCGHGPRTTIAFEKKHNPFCAI
ncbi:MAG: MBL fold metallo-hydrolase [Flammeovirgaceae bacterium]